MDRPCVKCVVQAMCKIGCPELSNYIREYCRTTDPGVWNYENIAELVREGKIDLFFNKDKELKWRIIAR